MVLSLSCFLDNSRHPTQNAEHRKSYCFDGSKNVSNEITELPKSIGMLENLIMLKLTKCKVLCNLPGSTGKLKSLHRLFMDDTGVTKLPESFGMLSSLMTLHMEKKRPNNSEDIEEPIGSSQGKVVLLNSFSSLLPSILRGLSIPKELSLPGRKKPKSLPQLPSSLLQGLLRKKSNLRMSRSRISDWLSQGVIKVSESINLAIKALNLEGVPNTDENKDHLCKYPVGHPLVFQLKDGYNMLETKRNPPHTEGIELKKILDLFGL
nr:disease resistance protein TAO1-like [Ziziphus jujuba var. spinosa]